MWVRPEAESALLWAARSPEITPGLYGSIDTGAGTTDCCFFNIVEVHDRKAWQKGRLAFFSGFAGPSGLDAVREVLASATGESDLAAVRGKEVEALRSLGGAERVKVGRVLNEISNIAARAHELGFEKWQSRDAWSRLRLFFLGGGSKVPDVRTSVLRRLGSPGVAEPGQPEELRRPDDRAFDGDATFLLTAYGLSYSGEEILEVIKPWGIELFNPDERPVRRERPDRDELYPK